MTDLNGYELALRIPATHLSLNGHKLSVFGGWIMSQMDISSAIPAIKMAKGNKVVTRAVNNLEFISPAFLGDLISFYTKVTSIGNTSISIHVQAIAERNSSSSPETLNIAHGDFIFVAINRFGKPIKFK